MISSVSKTLSRSTVRVLGARAFSNMCEPAEKVRCVLEEYRQQHYQYETRHRFQQDVVKAVREKTDVADANVVAVEALNKFLVNIGRAEQQLTDDEIREMMAEAGRNANDRYLPVDKVLQLM